MFLLRKLFVGLCAFALVSVSFAAQRPARPWTDGDTYIDNQGTPKIYNVVRNAWLTDMSRLVNPTTTAFTESILDDPDAATVRGTIGVDPAGTDNSTPVTEGVGSRDYVSFSGQELTFGLIDLDDLSATGTRNSSTVLHGDNVFRAPSGGGSAASVQSAIEGFTLLDANLANDLEIVVRDRTNGNALFKLDIGAAITIGDIGGVSISSPAVRDALMYDGTNFANRPLVAADISDFPLRTTGETWTIEAPTATTNSYVMSATDITIAQLDCLPTGATAPDLTVSIRECDANGASCALSGLDTPMTVSGVNISDNTVSNPVIEAGNRYELFMSSFATAPEKLHCTLRYATSG